jgi:adenosylcobinamide-GDP ribazoletransferase
MKSFLFALKFLTIIPIRSKFEIDENKFPQSTIYFPLIGLLLGLILVVANRLLLTFALGQSLISVILVVLLIILTGGLHLDGLADTFDAFGSRKDRMKMLEIMRDSRIGTMGVLSLISIILIKASFLSALEPYVFNLSLILMCVLSRYALVFSMYLFPYAREEGKAKIFTEGINFKTFSLATALSLLCAIFFWGLKGLIVFIVVMAFVFLVSKFITHKIGGVTGDTLGAINELAEPFVLLNILILSKI